MTEQLMEKDEIIATLKSLKKFAFGNVLLKTELAIRTLEKSELVRKAVK